MAAKPSFDQFELCPEVRQSIAAMGYAEPTSVQLESIPPALEGRDLVVQSRTGTGKTAAFGIPLVERIDRSKVEPQALVLCPTRELAVQVHAEIAAIGKHRGLKTFPIYGGASMRKQIDALHAGLHVVVGTPGRILDHLRSRRLSLSSVHYLVLDEADEMLSMGFYEEVSKILDHVPRARQTMLFSATIPPGVEGIIYSAQKEPLRIALSSDSVLAEDIHHAYYVSPSMEKSANLARIMLHEEPRSAIIFVNTRDDARVVTGYLKQENFEVEMLSGEMSQRDRERVMGMIKRNELRYMVATEVAARGIDISGLSHVINYSVPDNRDLYVHRTGRTGRIGRTGTAITIVGFRDLPKWGDIEGMKGLDMEQRQLPTDDEIFEKQVDRVIYVVRHLHPSSIGENQEGDALPPRPEPAQKYKAAAERLLEQGLEPDQLAHLLEKALAPPPEVEPPARVPEPAESGLDSQAPVARKRRRPPRRRS